jgi:hypothetical protein
VLRATSYNTASYHVPSLHTQHGHLCLSVCSRMVTTRSLITNSVVIMVRLVCHFLYVVRAEPSVGEEVVTLIEVTKYAYLIN